VTITCGEVLDQVRLDKAIKAVQRVDPAIINITATNDTNFEYMGVHKAWTLAKTECPDVDKCIILYFHSKGAFNNFNGIHPRTFHNIMLTNLIPNDWKYVINVFQENVNASSIGMNTGCTTTAPWQYHNFWWARARFLNILEEPKTKVDRHYYEYYTGQVPQDKLLENAYIGLCDTKYNVSRPVDSNCDNNELPLAFVCTCYLVALLTNICKHGCMNINTCGCEFCAQLYPK
jgi:hypothetical protein